MATIKIVSKENFSYSLGKVKAFVTSVVNAAKAALVSDITVTGATIKVTKDGKTTSSTIPNVTTQANGLMLSTDKSKLDGISEGAQANVIEKVSVGGVDLVPSSKTVTVPVASASESGTVKVGAGLAINEGVLSATGGGTADSVDWSGVQNRPTKVSQFTNDSGFQTAEQVSETVNALKTSLGNVLNYKGSKDTFAALPSTGNSVGDVYNVAAANGNTPAGTNYAWDGTKWDALGGEVDLSGLMQKTDIEELTEAEIDEIFAAA
jgi:hypothetical protein|nr:MAG TPA: hypothetical protein [Caudoviricetes sp.]